MSDFEKIIQTLSSLCTMYWVSGFESNSGITSWVYEVAKKNTKNTYVDRKWNIISIMGSGSKKILLDAHMDEVWFIVTNIKDGEIQIMPIWRYHDLSRLSWQKICFVNKNIEWTILYEKNKLFFHIDNEQKNIVGECAQGDIITFKRFFKYQKEDWVIEASALDNRVWCAVLFMLMGSVSPPRDFTYIYSFSTQEEIDNSNLDDIALELGVSFGIIVESAYAQPVNFDSSWMIIPQLGSWCAIQHQWENFFVKEQTLKLIKSLAIDNHISYQEEIPSIDFWRTNCSKLQSIPELDFCAINIPVRNQHEQISTTSLFDIHSAYQLIRAFLNRKSD